MQVSGDRVRLDRSFRPATTDENQQVYTWTPSEGMSLLSTTSHGTSGRAVYGDRVVWYGSGGSDGGTDGEIFTWTPTGGLVQITKNAGDDQTPEVYGDRVVWAGQGSNTIYQIFTWTPSVATKKVSSETSNPAYPVVSGDRISWCGDGTKRRQDVDGRHRHRESSELEDAGHKNDLHASGDRFVWTCGNGLFTWTPSRRGRPDHSPTAPDARSPATGWRGASGPA